MATKPEPNEDAVTERAIAFLEAEGAGAHGHGPGRSLLDHLRGTAALLDRWGQPPWLQHAALVHSVYGTEARRRRLIAPARRAEVSALVGERAERIAYLFAVIPRRRLSAGTHRWAPGAVMPGADREELDAVLMLHLANLADQACAPDRSPGAWLAIAARMAELLEGSPAIALPGFAGALAEVTPDDEASGLRAYREGLAATDPVSRADRLAQAAVAFPVAGEPCVWLADAAWRRGDPETARAWAQRARQRLELFAVAWDKRLSNQRWLALTERLTGDPGERGPIAAADPVALSQELSGGGSVAVPATRLEPAAAERRFAGYMDALADAPGSSSRILYPELDSRPWFEPAGFRVASELERNFESIRTELLALDASLFSPGERADRAQRRVGRHLPVRARAPPRRRVRGVPGDHERDRGRRRDADRGRVDLRLADAGRRRTSPPIAGRPTCGFAATSGSPCPRATARSGSRTNPAAGARDAASCSTTPTTTRRGTTLTRTGSC